MNNILQILEKAISQDQNEIRQAYELLEQFCRTNLFEYLKSLSDVLVNKEINGYVRMLAGLQLKNQLTSKDENERKRLQQQWLSLPENIRNQIKINVINSLGTETARPSASSQCVAYIAAIEMPHNLWPDLIKLLTQNATRPDVDEQTKVATLEAIGYIRQEVNQELLADQSNEMLTAIVNNMRKDEPSNSIKLTATTALLNSLDYIKANFDTENERHFIMQVVCEATQCTEVGVQVAALQCLVKIMSLFYQYMEHYMGVALFPITMQAIKTTNQPDICLQGIEFWSNVCEEEIELQFEASEAAEQGRPPQRTSKFYAKGALQFLVPSLLHILTQQDEDADEDEWNPCKAASVCLALLANCTGDDIPPHVLPFIVSNIHNSDWHFREAAMMALGSILEGPSQCTLVPIVTEALPTVIQLTRDSSICVRDTTTWVLSIICQQVAEVVFKPDVLKLVLDVLIEALKSEPRVAVHSCLAFIALSESANDLACLEENVVENPKQNALSEYFELIITHLLQCTERPDSLMNNLRSSAYEALMDMIKNSPMNCYQIVRQTTMVILDRLNRILAMETSGNVDQSSLDLQSLLCSALQSVLRKMIPEDAPKISDAIMTATLQMLEYSAKTGSINEDALLVVGALADVLEKNFLNYLPACKIYLLLALKSYQNYSLCSLAVGVVSDLCQSLGRDIAPFGDELISALMEMLRSNLIPKVKSDVLSVFGDIAMAIGPEFEKYSNTVLQTLVDAVTTSLQYNSLQNNSACNHVNFEMIEYLHKLWESILLAYTGIVQALKNDDEEKPNPLCLRLLQPHINYINQFLLSIAAKSDEIPDSVIQSAAGLIGDLMPDFNVEMITLCEHPHIQQMFNRGKKSKSTKTRSTIIFVIREMKRVKSALVQQQGGQPQQNSNQQGQQLFASQIHNAATASCYQRIGNDQAESSKLLDNTITNTDMVPHVLQMKHIDHDYINTNVFD